MDLKSLEVTNEAIDMPVYNPLTGEKLDIVIQVIGRDSDEFKEKFRAIHKRAIQKAPRGDLSKLSSDDDEYFAIQIRAIHIKGWSGVEEDGKPLPYTKENAEHLVKSYPVIADQIQEFVEDRANFMKAS